ncbi:MAG: VTT domain-containing protein [Caldisphaeraceae archaeon]|nr:VTT domain-containing protein [Caldisphaeraceae archaeon]
MPILTDSFIYLSIFSISFVSNVIPFGGPPYTIITATAILKLGDAYYWPLIVLASLGAILSKIIIYLAGKFFKKSLRKNRNIMFLSKVSDSNTFYIILFTLAVIPIFPFDDYLFIAAGAVEVSLLKAIFALVVAKLIKTALEVYIELKVILAISSLLTLAKPTIGAILTIAFIVFGIIIFKIDWEHYYNKIKGRIGRHI